MKDELFSELAASIHEGGAILGGDQPASRFFTISPPDIKKIRIGFELTQEQFAALLGISVRTLRKWATEPAGSRCSWARSAPGCNETPGSSAGCGRNQTSLAPASGGRGNGKP
jgi:hypothetical protein